MIAAIYRISDGAVQRFVTCPPDHIELQCQEGEDFYLNQWNDCTHIINNEPVTIIPEPTPEEIIMRLTNALERYYDSIAQMKRYDNRLTCALRAGYAGPFQAEGQTFAIWMDNCNAYAYGVMAAVQSGQRVVPTTEGLLEELPEAPWP